MSAFDFFDRIYCIHLPNSARYDRMKAQLEKIGRTAAYVNARPPQGLVMNNMRRNAAAEFGVNLSHMKAIGHAIADGAERPLFLEDDVTFEGEPAVDELPEHWSMLYLGGHPREKVQRYSDHLVQVGRFSFAEAYSINRPFLREFFDFWCDRIGQREAMFDFILGEWAAKRHGFCCYPIVTRQASGVSQVSGEHDEKGALLTKGWAKNLTA